MNLIQAQIYIIFICSVLLLKALVRYLVKTICLISTKEINLLFFFQLWYLFIIYKYFNKSGKIILNSRYFPIYLNVLFILNYAAIILSDVITNIQTIPFIYLYYIILYYCSTKIRSYHIHIEIFIDLNYRHTTWRCSTISLNYIQPFLV